jgi:RNA polymerase sigma factor (sigma-70 family)
MSRKAVATDLEYLMVTVRPRLMRFACAQGITVDAADDVVQETLLEAWQHLDRLYSLRSFEGWLHGICRNVCRRWMRKSGVQSQHTLATEVLQDAVLSNMPDPLNLDPAEELSIQDLQVLLDRALSYLSDENRLLIELCYLAEIPQRETALRLGMTIRALESRLYRARRQLQQVLTGELRTDAEIFGLTVVDNPLAGWNESREWCWDCGKHRLYGLFEPLPDGRTNFVMKCPKCGQCFDTEGCVPLDGVRSLRPARKRVLQTYRNFVMSYRNGWGTCLQCGRRKRARLMTLEEYFTQFSPALVPPVEQRSNLFLVVDCDICAIPTMTNACVHIYTHSEVQRFRQRYPRAFAEPHIYTEYAGLSAICQNFTDPASSARLSTFVQQETLLPLAVFQA